VHFDVHTAGFRPKHSTKAILGSANNAGGIMGSISSAIACRSIC